MRFETAENVGLITSSQSDPGVRGERAWEALRRSRTHGPQVVSRSSRRSALITDFINIEILAQAVASKMKRETSGFLKRVFNLDKAAAYCGLTRDGFKKKVVRDRIQKIGLDKCWCFDKADLDAWIDGHKDEITGKAA